MTIQLTDVGDDPEIFFPADVKPVRFQRADGKVIFVVRDFDVHEVVISGRGIRWDSMPETQRPTVR
ncbi:MAG: hypothetical protein QF473_11535, partial [Planctomycetota bacterium]|nr:hypothetical protein [Planctomycetota bacterium]